MATFFHEAWFFSWELFKFMTFFYVVWAPGFLISGIITCRYRQSAWHAMVARPSGEFKGLVRATGLGIVGSSGRKTSINATVNLLKQGVSPSHALAFLIASRNMTIHFWAIFALSLGAEFATGQLLGALIMIGIVIFGLRRLNLEDVEKPVGKEPEGNLAMELPAFPSWRSVLISVKGWQSVLRFTGREIVRFTPSLAVGIILGGLILASGLRPWWPRFADYFGYATPPSDLTNALVGPLLSSIAALSPVGNLPVIHGLFSMYPIPRSMRLPREYVLGRRMKRSESFLFQWLELA